MCKQGGGIGFGKRITHLLIKHPRLPSPPAPNPEAFKTASASKAARTATTYCAAVRRYTRL